MLTNSESVDSRDSVEDVFKPLAMFLGLVYFISLMIVDACVAIVGKPARIWNPGKSLLISALTIQILSFLKIKIIEVSADVTDKEILQNEFVGESGRVVTCVLIGYLLPGMARAGSATDWRTLVALVISLFTSEFYYLATLFYPLPWQKKGFRFTNESSLALRVEYRFYYYRVATNVVIMLLTILVVLFSISAILAGRTLRGMLAQRISVIQWDKRKENEEGSWQKFEGKIVESWFLARVCDPQFVIARSVLISAVGLVVTICILFLAIRHFALYVDFLPRFFKYEILFMAWTLEWAFILIGGTIIFRRWFTAVVYLPRYFVKKRKLRRCTRPFVEDYWTRSILELIQMYNLQKWRLQELSKDGILSGLPLYMATTMKVHYLLYLLWPLQISLLCFSKCCFFISELVFGFKFVRICLLGSDKVSSQFHEEFPEYREMLEKVCMPGEDPMSLWLANEKSMNQVKDHFKRNKEKGRNCKDLITFIKSHFHPESGDDGRFVNKLERSLFVAENFPALNENCMRMTALSLLNVIIILLPLHKDVHRLTKAIEAYKQALDLMSFVDNSDPQYPTTMDVLKVIDIEADRVSVAVCNEFQTLLKLHKEKPNSLKRSSNSAAPEATPERALETINELQRKAEVTPERALEAIKELQEKAEEQLNEQKNKGQSGRKRGSEQNVGEEYFDSRDWSAIAASYSKCRVCKLIRSRDFDSENKLMESLYEYLADVIAYCLLKLPSVLVKRCREGAVKFEEEKIWDAMYAAGKLMGVMQKCNVILEGNLLEPKFHTDTSNENQPGGALGHGSGSRERSRHGSTHGLGD